MHILIKNNKVLDAHGERIQEYRLQDLVPFLYKKLGTPEVEEVSKVDVACILGKLFYAPVFEHYDNYDSDMLFVIAEQINLIIAQHTWTKPTPKKRATEWTKIPKRSGVEL